MFPMTRSCSVVSKSARNPSTATSCSTWVPRAVTRQVTDEKVGPLAVTFCHQLTVPFRPRRSVFSSVPARGDRPGFLRFAVQGVAQAGAQRAQQDGADGAVVLVLDAVLGVRRPRCWTGAGRRRRQ